MSGQRQEIEQMKQGSKLAKSNKQTLKRTGTILSEKTSSFEDSRVTLLLFEKYRIVEMTRFCVIFACQILAILQYESSFQDQFEQTFDSETTLLLYLIFFQTIVAITLTLTSYQVLLAYQKKAMMVTPQASLLDSNLIYGLIIEVLLMIPSPTPFTQRIKVPFHERYTDTPRYYYVNEILTYILTCRVVLLINIALKFQAFYNSQIGRLCRLYSTDFDTHLVFKICMKDIPGFTLMGLFGAGMLLFGYSMEIAERALLRDETSFSDYNVGKSLWVTLITIATVGYGDFYPTTDLGRISMAVCVFWGVSNTSLFTAMLYSMLQAETSEELVWALLEKANVRNIMKACSQYLFVRIQRLKLKAQNQNTNDKSHLKEQVELIQETLKAISQMKRQYRDIDGEATMVMAKRKFKDINNMFEEHLSILKESKRLQVLSSINYQYCYESNVNSGTKNKQSSPHIQTYQTDDKQSKDEAFFANLQDNESNLLLMDFRD
ncbi:unnamed protein product [Paramecium primaurelia]|uniref:Potassium channel domain-containing protein n=2 Tax=Paramecium TaxID=5884 RepID=A0A8S1YLH9_9CILI|nr:unnamed protein product [Paramecium primaurelia]CAD8211924.1 unnamed protein product [Paramecium pentaurelia]